MSRRGSAARLTGELHALDRAYSTGHHGRWSCRRRAELVDGSLRALFAPAPAARVALVALGGYGRGELAPASDIDLLILHEDGEPDGLEALVESLLYPLWDARLAVGHAVRTPEECLTLAVGRLDSATALLDARPLAGDASLCAHARALVLGWIREDPRGFAARLLEAARERARRAGSASHLLEPDLKDGSGGLRDIHTLGWLGAAIGERPGLPTLDGVGLLGSAERAAIDDAEEFLVRVRSALHLLTGRKSDRLALDQQPEIARGLGFADEPGLPAVDALMRSVFVHARQVEHVVGSVFDRFLHDDGRSSSDEEAASTPEDVIEAFAAAAERARVLSPSALDRIEALDVPTEIEWTPGVRDGFLRIIRAQEQGVRTLEAMDRIGLLERLLPEWRPVRCRPQRDPYHRYTVDVHLLEALAGMGRLLRADTDADPVANEAARLAPDHDALLLGALLHDIGKTGEGPHVPVGARRAAAALDRMRIPRPTRDLALFMVEHHLLLPDTATRRDLGDEDLVVATAARVETAERLAALYLLAAADAVATGPHAWTPWRQTLVRELVAKIEHVLERGEMGAERAERLRQRTDEVRRLLADERPDDVACFLGRLPPSYLLAVEPARVAHHRRMLRAPLGANEVRTAAAPGPRPDTYALTVVARDRPGLLSWVAGALTLAGLDILSAQVFTTEDGVAVDVFEVAGSFEAEVGEDRWREFRAALRKVIEGRMSLVHGVAEKARHYPAPRSRSPVRVIVDNGASDFFTVIEVAAPDRVGLLFDITRTLSELGLDVHLAKVATYGERVVDAFYVRDPLGRKVDDSATVEAIERALGDRASASGRRPKA